MSECVLYRHFTKGGNPYADNWRRDGFKGFDPDTPLDQIEIDDGEELK